MDRTWTWIESVGARTYERAVTLDDEGVTERDPSSTPSERRSALAAAFATPHLIFVREPRVRFELFAALAARLAPADLRSPLEATRLAFWRAYEPTRVRPENLVWVRERRGDVPVASVLRLDPRGLFVQGSDGVVTQHLPDEVFVYGPPVAATPAHLRETLRARLLAALRADSGLSQAEAFPRLDHARIAARSWSWDVRSDGETGLTTGPGVVTAGYQYGHDMGWSDYAPEGVLRGDPRLHLQAPPEVERELLDVLRAAERPHRAMASATGEPPEAFFALRARAVDRSPWAVSLELTYPLDQARQDHDWATRAALGLYASLRPENELPTEPLTVDEYRHGHAYNWHDDRAWMASDGTGVILAEECFGGMPGDGVRDVFHVMPGHGRRVIFDLCTDCGQGWFEVLLSADDTERLASLCAHVTAWLGAIGFRLPTEKPPGTARFRTDERSARG